MKGLYSKLKARLRSRLNKKAAANFKYAEATIGGALGISIMAMVSLFVLVTVAGLAIFANVTQIDTIETAVLNFVSNAFSLLASTGTFVALTIFLAVIVIVFIYLRKMLTSQGGGEYAG